MLIRRKIARSVVRRVKRSESLKTKRKLRPLRSHKNAARKYSSKSGLNFREMMGGMKGKVTYLVYYGSPKIHNPSVRLLHTFVGILFCDGNNWILCVSSELADKYKHVRYVRMKKNIPDHYQVTMDAQSERLKEQYAAIDKTLDDLLDDGIHEPISETKLTSSEIIARYKDAAADHIVCQFIKRLCNLNDEQEKKLKTYLEDPAHNDGFQSRNESSGFECDFDWVFTFNTNLFSSGGDLSAYLHGKQVKVLEKVLPIDNPQLEGLISELPTAPASTTSSTSSPEVVDRNFLLVVPKIRYEPKYPGSKFTSIQTEASQLLQLEYNALSGSYRNQEKFNKIIGRFMSSDGSIYLPRDKEVLEYVKEITADR